ncbi:MAG TPA: exopolysaccharide biosynthesis polyprenyl glycosylphosphotransferase [Solirubrobacteraceae bacterium]|jgi:exopolysaccharide biosynthesis polyprenyl glycosylphosphotransferase|nr:exopolysaccharide biosynthesis polyprenyl glycosylphosphotransferase [Solirubrobacteraceae bacterium]
MNGPRLTRQTTSPSLPAIGGRSTTRRAPGPRSAATGIFHGPLQRALEEPGWSVLRPTVDFVLLCLALPLALGGLHATLHISAVRAPLLALPPLTMLLLYLRGLYRTRLRALILDGLAPVLSAVSVAAMAVAMIGQFANGEVPTESIWVHAWLYALLALGGGRIALASAQRLARSRGAIGRPVLIVGAGLVGAQVARRLEDHPEYGLSPVGFLDDDPRPLAEVGGRDVPVLGTAEDLDEVVRRTAVKNLIVAFSSVADARVSRLIQRCQELGIEVSVVPRMFDTINNRVGYDTVGGLPLMSFTSVNPRGLQFALKHASDRILALALLILLSPLLLCAALVVRLSSPGPVLYRQRRVGRDGTLFDLYKFRSMRMDELDRLDLRDQQKVANGSVDANGPHALTAEDITAFEFMLGGDTAPGGVEGPDRRTLIGRFLRRTSIDELPQLFNVLRGEMSLIGPRPERPEFVELFRQDIARYGDRHRVRSGITGWAQVHGLRGQTSLAERVEWDNYYIAHWSLSLDLKILALTFGALFRNAE